MADSVQRLSPDPVLGALVMGAGSAQQLKNLWLAKASRPGSWSNRTMAEPTCASQSSSKTLTKCLFHSTQRPLYAIYVP